MDFTREPVIETIITPKEGCKLAVRNSKGAGQEEFFVDAVEIVSFGNSFFFRSLERPKSFFVPVTDYEILEVRETRMVLKNVGTERTIKIGGGKEGGQRPAKEEKTKQEGGDTEAVPIEPRVEKKRERRRSYRRRRGQEEGKETEEQRPAETKEEQEPSKGTAESRLPSDLPPAPALILEPPKTLISETISKYREHGMYSDAFFDSEEDKEQESSESDEVQADDGEPATEQSSEEVAGAGAGFPVEAEEEQLNVEEPTLAEAGPVAESVKVEEPEEPSTDATDPLPAQEEELAANTPEQDALDHQDQLEKERVEDQTPVREGEEELANDNR